MTIKRQLFIANILMIVLPVLLSAIAGLLIFYTVVHLTTERHQESAEGRRGRSEARSLVHSWSGGTSLSEMLKEIENFNARYSENISLTLYKDGEPVQPEAADALSDTFYSIRNPMGYQVVLTRIEPRFSVLRVGFEARNLVVAAGIFVYIIFRALIVFLSHRFLSRSVLIPIITSIDSLRYGVGQIRDGNLSYRLDAGKKNEFDAVSDDFNEMAVRLLDFVNSRLHDETTRKELIAGISHDLRTPMTSVRAYIEGFENALDSTPEIRARYIQTIKNRLYDLEQIADTLFLFSSLDLDEFPWRMEKTDLVKELRQLISDLKNEYEERGLGISLLPENKTEIWVNIDSRQMRNVIINIIENSVKYKTKERGKMEIAISLDESSGDSSDDSSAIITMTDDGPGVPEESLERLFEIFYRVDPSRSETVKGNGLGLAIVAKIVRGFGGTIQAKNKPSGGLSIIIQFPLWEKSGGALP
jgi:signal transduction histidine kinase